VQRLVDACARLAREHEAAAPTEAGA
jgi:hypothetical protein